MGPQHGGQSRDQQGPCQHPGGLAAPNPAQEEPYMSRAQCTLLHECSVAGVCPQGAQGAHPRDPGLRSMLFRGVFLYAGMVGISETSAQLLLSEPQMSAAEFTGIPQPPSDSSACCPHIQPSVTSSPFLPAPFLICPSLPTFHPHSRDPHLLVFSRTSTFFRSSKFSVEQDSTLQRREKKKNLSFIRGASAKPGARMEAGGVQRKNKQRSSYSGEIRKRARLT